MKKVMKKMLSLAVVFAMLMSCFSTIAIAATPTISGLTADGTYSADDFVFGIKDAVAVAATTDGAPLTAVLTASHRKNATDYSTVKLTGFTKLGAQKLVVTADGTEVFNGTVNVEKTASVVTQQTLKDLYLADLTTHQDYITVVDEPNNIQLSVKADAANHSVWFHNTHDSSADILEFSFDIKSSTRYLMLQGKLWSRSGSSYTSTDNVRYANDWLFTDNELNKWVHFRALADNNTKMLSVYRTVEGEAEALVYSYPITYDVRNIGSASIQVGAYNKDFYKQNNTTDTVINIKDVVINAKTYMPGVTSVLIDGTEAETDSTGAYSLSVFAESIAVNMSGNISSENITFAKDGVAAGTVSVSGNTITVGGLDLEETSDYVLDIPASATSGTNAYGLPRTFTFKTGASSFFIKTPVNGASYDAADDIFNIYNATDATLVLNGETVTSSELSSKVGVGKNILEAYVHGVAPEYQRVEFNVTKTFTKDLIPKVDFQDGNDVKSGIIGDGIWNVGPSNNTDTYNPKAITEADGNIALEVKTGNWAWDFYPFNDRTGESPVYANRSLILGDNAITSGKVIFSVDIKANTGTNFGSFTVRQKLYGYPAADIVSFAKATATDGTVYNVPENGWFNLKYEYDFNSNPKKVKCYFDGHLIKEEEMTNLDTANGSSTYFMLRGVSTGTAMVDNLHWYCEFPATVDAVTYGNGTAVGNLNMVPAGTTSFNVKTSLHLSDDEINNSNIKFYANGTEVSGITVSKVSADDTGTTFSVTLPSGDYTDGKIAVKSGTSATALTWPGATTAGTSTATVLDKDIVIPVLAAKDGIYAKLNTSSADGGEYVSAVVMNTTGTDVPLKLYVASYTDATKKTFSNVSSVPFTAVDDEFVSASTFTTEVNRNIMLWNSMLKPLTDVK